ncbi:hypothetical protein PWR63_00710 [Paraburkholderia sp. A2WS-5]|uniref:hypothetical protein n=1 Tax=unclassified Paraburkholderia TaxID=2615204 RepID=UPI003B780A77
MDHTILRRQFACPGGAAPRHSSCNIKWSETTSLVGKRDVRDQASRVLRILYTYASAHRGANLNENQKTHPRKINVQNISHGADYPADPAERIALIHTGTSMRPILNWLAAAASLIGLFFTLRPPAASLTNTQIGFVFLTVLVFGAVAIADIREERKRAAKQYKNTSAINDYMYAILRSSGKCEICSRDASWISEQRIYSLLENKARRGELTFLVHHSTEQVKALGAIGAEIIEYSAFGFEPVTRFTVVNAGNHASSYVAVGRKKPNEPHIIEELDSSHPTYSMAHDLIRSIRAANDKFKKN